jgi:hypothetical protein
VARQATRSGDNVASINPFIADVLGLVARYGWHVFPARFIQTASGKWEKRSWKSAASSNGRPWGMTKDADEIHRDFARPDRTAVGVPTGTINNCFVIEADTKAGHGVDGLAALQQLEAKHGPLPDTLMAESPSGSLHYYYDPLSIRTKNSQSKLAIGVDVRGDGGMVVAPPSQRHNGSYRWHNDGAIAPAPAWLLALAARDEQDDPQQAAYTLLAQAWPAAGSGHHQAALAVGGFLARLGQSPGEVDEIVAGIAAAIGTERADELRRAARSAAEAHVGGGRAYGFPELAKNFGRPVAERVAHWLGYNAEEAAPAAEPVDLWARFDPPALPRGLLPVVIERFAVEQGELMGVDPAGLAMEALTVCAGAVPDHIELQPKRHDQSWTESARIWTALVGDPSVKKSPIIRQAAKPLTQLDAQLCRDYSEEKARYDALPPDERRQAERPQQIRVRIEDATMEAVQEVLRDSPNGVLCLQDELAGWFGSMDKYSRQHGAAKNRGFWLQAYNGGEYVVDRVGRGSFSISNLSVSLLGGIQPGPMRQIAADTVDDGLLQRTIMIMLRRGTMGKDEPTSAAVHHYASLVEQLHELLPLLEPLQFDDGTLAIRQQLEQKHLELMAYESINKKLAAHIGKYDALFARLCLLWHCIEHHQRLPPVVTEQTAERVAKFMHGFLLPHALAFYAGVLGLADEHDRLAAVAGYILARRLDRITNRDVQRGDRTMRKLDRRDIESVFNQLDALGWIDRVPAVRAGDPPSWNVNPEVHRRFEQRGREEAKRRAREREMIASLLSTNSEL